MDEQYLQYTLTLALLLWETREDELLALIPSLNYQILDWQGETTYDVRFGELYDHQEVAEEVTVHLFVLEAEQELLETQLLRIWPHCQWDKKQLVYDASSYDAAYLQPTDLGATFQLVVAAEQLDDSAARQQFVLPPRNAFGTGHHDTTQLAVQLLEATDVRGRRVLDCGTGTGVLALVAASLGARYVRATDYDAVAVKEAQEIVALNQLSARIEVTQNDFVAGIAVSEFDVIIANLSLNLFERFLPAFLPQLSVGQELIFAGIQQDQAVAFQALLASRKLHVCAQRQSEQWLAYHLRVQETGNMEEE